MNFWAGKSRWGTHWDLCDVALTTRGQICVADLNNERLKLFRQDGHLCWTVRPGPELKRPRRVTSGVLSGKVDSHHRKSASKMVTSGVLNINNLFWLFLFRLVGHSDLQSFRRFLPFMVNLLREGNVFTSVCHSVHRRTVSLQRGQRAPPPTPG